MAANAGGMGGDGGPSRSYGDIMAALFREKVGLSAEDALKAALLTQGLIDTTHKAAQTDAEQQFQRRLDEERQKTKKRKGREDDREGALESLSPRAKEKSLRKEARAAERQRIQEEKKKAEERAKRPKLPLNEGGAPLARGYRLFRSQLGQILRSHYGPMDYWGKKKQDERFRIREQIKERFLNGSFLDDRFLNKKISLSLADMRNHVREKMRKYLADCSLDVEVIRAGGCPAGEIPEDAWSAWLEEELQVRAWQAKRRWKAEIAEAEKMIGQGEVVNTDSLHQKLAEAEANLAKIGKPPSKLRKALKRVARRPKVTHRMGQGGSQRLKAEFVSAPSPSSPCHAFLRSAAFHLPNHPRLIRKCLPFPTLAKSLCVFCFRPIVFFCFRPIASDCCPILKESDYASEILILSEPSWLPILKVSEII